MQAPYTQLYLHLVWATWDRLPLVTSALEQRIYGAITAKCRALRCDPLAIGCVEDHVHLLIRLHATVAVATLVKHVKGSSSHLVTHEIAPDEFFKWQGSYGAFTLAKSDVPRIRSYVEHQKSHHADLTVWQAWEETSTPEEAGE